MSLLQTTFDNETICVMRPENPTKTFSSGDVSEGTESVVYKAAKLLSNRDKVLSIKLPIFTSTEISTKITSKKNNLTAVTPGEIIYDSTNDLIGTISTYDITTPLLDQTKILKPTSDEILAKIDSVRGFTDDQATVYAKNENYNLKGKNLTHIISGTCIVDNITLTDSTANFNISGVIANDIVISNGELSLVSIVDSTSELILTSTVRSGSYYIYHPMTVAEAKNILRNRDKDNNIISDLTTSESNASIIDERKTQLTTLQVEKIIGDCLEVPSLSTILESGTCNITYDSTSEEYIITSDESADFITAGVSENNLLKIENGLYKVDSVTNATELILKSGPTVPISNGSYEILDSSFMSQFDYIKT